MRKLIALITLLPLIASGQNELRYSHTQFSQSLNNPAAICADAPMQADLYGRNQWLGIDGAPYSFAFNAQYEFNSDMAIGIVAHHDRIGVQETTIIQAQYAYRVPIKRRYVLSFGASAGIDQKAQGLSDLYVRDPNDPSFSNFQNKLIFNAGLGVYYRAPRFYTGIGLPRLFQNNYFGDESGFLPPRWHYFSTTGWLLGDKRYTFNPIIQIKATWNAPVNADLILRNVFNQQFAFSVGYRSEHAITAGFDITINNVFRIGYIANYDLFKYSRWGGLSNEICVGVGLPYNYDPNSFYNRKYVNQGGGFKSNYRRNSRRRPYRKL
jgi:type IX secretion system PorP/SprF family membrane protein